MNDQFNVGDRVCLAQPRTHPELEGCLAIVLPGPEMFFIGQGRIIGMKVGGEVLGDEHGEPLYGYIICVDGIGQMIAEPEELEKVEYKPEEKANYLAPEQRVHLAYSPTLPELEGCEGTILFGPEECLTERGENVYGFAIEIDGNLGTVVAKPEELEPANN